jgi:reverse transcriptase-like protein
MGFGRKWIRWIMNCVSSASLSIIVNGSPLKPVKIEKGLRQGDPLSPYLFILVSEALVCILKKAEELRLIESVTIGKDKVNIKHLQFADDTLIFVPRKDAVVTNYFRILDVFALMSGLYLNYDKSNIISWCSDDKQWAMNVANQIGCKHTECPITYLGLPLGANMNKGSSWKPVISKIESKLSSWKAKTLSRAGRLVLIKSVLNSLPIYFMSMFRMPKIVAAKIVKLQRKFLWGETSSGKLVPPPVKWSSVELPKQIGGLGVGNILYKNLILLFKWWWRFSDSDCTLWKRILISIHNIKGLKASSESFGHIKQGTWAHLVSNDTDTKRIRDIVDEGLQIKVGDGNSTKFWHDKWCPNGPFKKAFPRLFSISLQREEVISQMGIWNGCDWLWNFRWRRSLYDWEMVDFDRLKGLIEDFSPQHDCKDVISWHGSGEKKFPIKEIVDKLYDSMNPMLPKPLTTFIWSTKAPPRALIVLWLASMERLKTCDFLVEKGIMNLNDAVCPFCQVVTETNPHILFTCHFSWSIWMKVLSWWGVTGVLQNSCGPFTIAWKHLVPRKKRGKLWNLILCCVIWSFWFERNKVKFESGSPDADKLFLTVKIRVGVWAKELLGLNLLANSVVSHNFDDA